MKNKSKTTVRWIIIAGLAFTACTDDDKPLPKCSDIGAPTTLLCNHAGVCTWDGMTCERDAPTDAGVDGAP